MHATGERWLQLAVVFGGGTAWGRVVVVQTPTSRYSREPRGARGAHVKAYPMTCDGTA
jgi:hypothetical protein